MMLNTISALAVIAVFTVFQAQATLIARDDPSIQAISGNGEISPQDPTAMDADQGDSDKWGWGYGYGRWGYGYPWYGYGHRRFYGGWWY
ncbi:hypothetical protein BGZ83_007607 [Gryganskiella cystojenkinii]|nr:hypothetical protein BGZ83_007607 [Gryganskiella cystojenkinii]